MKDATDLPRLIDLDDQPDDLRAGLAGLRSRVATPQQLARMAALLPLSASSVGSPAGIPHGAAPGATGSGARSAIRATKLALIGGMLLAGSVGIGGYVWWQNGHTSGTGLAPRHDEAPATALGRESSPATTRRASADAPTRDQDVTGAAAGQSAPGSGDHAGSGAEAEPAGPTVHEPGRLTTAPNATAVNGATRSATTEVGTRDSAAMAPNGRAPTKAASTEGSTGGSLRTGTAASSVTTSGSSQSTASEEDKYREARAALASNPAQALRLADEHRRIYGARSMDQEFEVLAIQALVRLGNAASARDRAARFARAFPGSPYQRKVDSIVGSR